MSYSRTKKATLSVATAAILQFVSIFFGIITPKIMIGEYGSNIYGTLSSIAQFLSYISLLEGGVGAVARSALYKSLAKNDTDKINRTYFEIKRFAFCIASIFAAYTIFLACTYKYIANIDFIDWLTTFLLVCIISVSTLAQYFIGFSDQILIQADQRNYIVNIVNIFSIVLNTSITITCVLLHVNVIILKLCSGVVFVLKPILVHLYIKRKFSIQKVSKIDEIILKDKWVGLGQHVAFFLHSNTDIVVLTLFTDMKTVAIYSVYYLIFSSITKLISILSNGMEALFGNMYAKGENETLLKTVNFYDTLISFVATLVFSVAIILIIPFIRLYTAGITDANYIQPTFAALLLFGEFINCIRTPYHNLIIAAGKFKETQLAAYLEAFLNISLSCLFVIKWGLIGVAIATLISFAFRYVYYAIYISKDIFKNFFFSFMKRIVTTTLSIVLIFMIGSAVLLNLSTSTYAMGCIAGFVEVGIALTVLLIVGFVFYRKDYTSILNKALKRLNKKSTSNN